MSVLWRMAIKKWSVALTTSKVHVGIIWFVFHVPQLVPLRFTQQNLHCINKSMMKDTKKRD